MPLLVAFFFGEYLMRVRIDLKTIKLIKTFNPHVDVNALYLPVENVFEERDASVRTKQLTRKQSIQEEYDFIYCYAKESFTNFKIVSDKTTYYVIVDGVVLSVPHDFEVDYGFSLHKMLVNDYENQTKHVDNMLKAAYINLYMSKEHNVSKHVFKSIFIDFFTNKAFNERKILSGGSLNRNFVCELTYLGHKFSFSTFSASSGVLVEFNFPEFKFRKCYPISSYNIDKFILDFVNESEYNCKSTKEAIQHLNDYILIRKMINI